jgi:hypothetical protein
MDNLYNRLIEFRNNVAFLSEVIASKFLFENLNDETLLMLYNQRVFDKYGIPPNVSKQEIISYLDNLSINYNNLVDSQVANIARAYGDVGVHRLESLERQLKYTQQQNSLLFQQVQQLEELLSDQIDLIEDLQSRTSNEEELQRLFVRNIVSNDIVCDNDADIVSLEKWTEISPETEIVQLIVGNNKKCYDKALFENMEVFHDWVPRVQGGQMDDMGRGGMPGEKRFYRLSLDVIYYVDKRSWDKMIRKQNIIKLEEIGKSRIGNKQGTFGVSEQHGQLPEEKIYKAVKN